MSDKRRGGFASFKGADLLGKLKQSLSPASRPASPSEPLSIEDELRAAADKPKAPPSAVKFKPKPELKAKPQPKKGKVEVIKFRSRAERDEALAAMRAAGPAHTEAAPAKMSEALNDFGKGVFDKLEPYRRSLDGFVATHHSSSSISLDDRNTVAGRIKSGATLAPEIVDPADGYFLGYDFGTSTTKAVARYPYGGVDEAFAIMVPTSICSSGQPHLWPTVLWWNRETGRFSLVEEDGWQQLDSFKTALLQGDGHRICKGSGITMGEAATAFVALHLAYALGAAVEAVPGFKLASLNVGVPVATFSGQENVRLFEHAIEAATRLVAKAETLTLADVRQAMAHRQEAALPYTRHAELSGAIAGYCAAPRFYVGGHMIIDCGSATLDMATFDLGQRDSRPIGIYAARVENLGADACQSFIARGVTIEECRRASRYEEQLVFRDTVKRKLNLFAKEAEGYPYQIILIGGGIHGEVHAPFFETLAKAFARPFHRPSIASTLRYEKACEPGRLILADGLARDPIDLRDVTMPRDPPPEQWRDPPAPGPEQV